MIIKYLSIPPPDFTFYFLFPKRIISMNRTIKLITLSLVCLVVFSQCQDDSGIIVKMGIEDYSSSEQKVIGDNLHKFIQDKKSDHIILTKNQNYGPAYDFVEKVFTQAVRTEGVTHLDFYNWSVHILVNDEFKNAFILPGGHLYIYTGLLKFIKTDAELFAVLTREIALADLGTVGKFLGEEHGASQMGDVLLKNPDADEVGIIKTLEQIPYDPEVTEAIDLYSIELACLNYNFDDQAIVDLINRSANKEIEWFATRPGYENRSQKIIGLTTECFSSSSNQEAYEVQVIRNLP